MNFFKPLRRKIGVITLILACAVAGLWVRSYTVSDEIEFTDQRFIYDYVSLFSGLVGIGHYDPGDGTSTSGARWGWRTHTLNLPLQRYRIEHGAFWLVVPFWYAAVPLTLLSGWLLLSKPRQPDSVARQIR